MMPLRQFLSKLTRIASKILSLKIKITNVKNNNPFQILHQSTITKASKQTLEHKKTMQLAPTWTTESTGCLKFKNCNKCEL